MIGENDKTGRYVSEDGDVKSFYQIAMQSAKENKDVEEAENGWIIDGELYKPKS